MKRILINDTHADVRRLAIVDGQQLLDCEIEIEGEELRKGNIYQGIISRIDHALGVCMVDYGEDRDGMLPLKDISKQCSDEGFSPGQLYNPPAVNEGDALMIQLIEEQREAQAAVLSTAITLSGRYLVLAPSQYGNGLSRYAGSPAQARLPDLPSQLAYPPGMAIAARHAAQGHSATELQRDLNYLLKLWEAIERAAQYNQEAYLIYQESNLVSRTIRDYFQEDIAAILIDCEALYEQAQRFMALVMPEHADRVQYYQEDTPLFEHFQIAEQMDAVYPLAGRTTPPLS